MKLLSVVAFIIATSACSSPPPTRPVRSNYTGNPGSGSEANPKGPASPTPANPQPSTPNSPAGGTGNGDVNTGGQGNTGGESDNGTGDAGDDENTENQDGGEEADGSTPNGAQLFADNCAGCHPSLPGRSAANINGAIDQIGVMRSLRQRFPLTNGANAEIDAIATYLNQ